MSKIRLLLPKVQGGGNAPEPSKYNAGWEAQVSNTGGSESNPAPEKSGSGEIMANTRPSGVENRNSQEESSPQRYGVNEAQYKELQNEATRMGYAGNIEKYKEDYAEKGQSDEDFAKSHF